MYEDIFEDHTEMSAEAVDAIETYEGLRSVLGEEYGDANYDELDAIFMEITADMSAEEAEFFKKFIKKVGRGLRKAGRTVAKVARPIARAISPIAKVALPAVGTIFGGPVGALAGQAGASLLGQIGKGGGRRSRPSRRRPRRMRARPRRRPSRAAGRLAGLLQSPQLRQALGSLVAGGRGRGAIRVGGSSIPIGALANLAGSLFAQAAEDAEALHGASPLPEYLMDDQGEAIDGIESAEVRAERLWSVLVNEGLLEDAIVAEDDDDEDDMHEWQDDFFDDFETLH